ncbi:hypothetical protein KL86PLE_40397 [uncultured Pleomorphomonas sp.]|uniref:Uncharacterized protein n=1 Tax=uncultured Pleomorphomonas sp. TaxID=442121 RepID=A0A212LGA8_9HYPH|nr:hypothetical protein KL86PLE_40397 [uncultured Pleomorphomonas sp.]
MRLHAGPAAGRRYAGGSILVSVRTVTLAAYFGCLRDPRRDLILRNARVSCKTPTTQWSGRRRSAVLSWPTLVFFGTIVDVHARRHAFCAVSHRFSAHRRRADGALQLALCQAARRQDAAPHRGHRPRAVDAGRRRRHHRRAKLAGPHLGGRADLAVPARRPPRRGGARAGRRRQGLLLLLHARRAQRDARDRQGQRPAAALRRPLARPRSVRGAGRRQAVGAHQGAAQRRDGDRGRGSGHRHLPQQGPRRLHHPALGRHAHLHARRGGRRPRHGRHPDHPRRRPPDQHGAPEDHLRRARLGHAEGGAHPADPRAGRRQAVQAPRRAGRRGLPGHGLPAGGAPQLPRPPRLGARRRRDPLHRRDDRPVRSRGHRPLAVALRLRQAGESQRPLHPPDAGRRAGRPCRRPARPHSRGRGAQGQARRGQEGAACRRHARPQGARQDASRADRQRRLPVRQPAALPRRQGGRPARRRRQDGARRPAAAPRRAARLERGGHRGGGSRLCRRDRPQARQGGTAAQGGRHRSHHVAADLRRARRARPRRGARPHRRRAGRLTEPGLWENANPARPGRGGVFTSLRGGGQAGENLAGSDTEKR